MSHASKIIATVVATVALSFGSVALVGGSQTSVDVAGKTLHCC